MNFSLIICTYMRPQPLLKLLNSVKEQTLYPSEILIIDGSTNNETKTVLNKHNFENLKYYKVNKEHRGLTKQRNYGINKVDKESEIVCFLDDDTVLDNNYFKAIIFSFFNNSEIVGVGGVAINENRWFKNDTNKKYSKYRFYQLDNWVVKEGLRNIVRNCLNLQSPLKPGVMPNFSHGRTCGYPLNGEEYPVDLLIGMSFSFRKVVFQEIRFSTYFEGYGLYEDADFSIRALKYGKNVINTKARLEHYHDHSGRPNKYQYGKMVARNGWYVWRVKYPKPGLKARIKWNLTFLLLMKLRFLNVFTTRKRYEALTEGLGRLVGWLSLLFNKPIIQL